LQNKQGLAFLHDGKIDSNVRVKATQLHVYQKVRIDAIMAEQWDDSIMVAFCQYFSRNSPE